MAEARPQPLHAAHLGEENRNEAQREEPSDDESTQSRTNKPFSFFSLKERN